MKIMYLFSIFFMCTACTLNINLTDTHGYANDVVDDTTSENVDPELNVPMKGI